MMSLRRYYHRHFGHHERFHVAVILTIVIVAYVVVPVAVRYIDALQGYSPATDAGVHALRQVASLTMSTELAARVILRALNAALPHDVRAREVREVPHGFDARRAALGKRYAYLIDNAAVPNPLLARYAWHVPGGLDVAAMRRALVPLRGRRDFGAFCAAPGRAKDPVCDVRALHVVRRRDRIAVFLSADRFLHHMARNIVGSAVAVGRGAREPDWLQKVLDSRDRRLAGATAPAQGLTLVRVLYPNFT